MEDTSILSDSGFIVLSSLHPKHSSRSTKLKFAFSILVRKLLLRAGFHQQRRPQNLESFFDFHQITLTEQWLNF